MPTTATPTCRPPIAVAPLLDDADLVVELARANGPYYMPGRYLVGSGTARGAAAATGQAKAKANPVQVGPVFRGDWAFDEPLVDGVEPLWHHPALVEAAGRMYDTDVVVPQQVYVNLSTPMPRQPASHVDIGQFRGVDRTNAPAWFLDAMGRSGLFEDVRVPIVTAVAWFYRGEAGWFRYWPDGPDADSRRHEDLWNTAIVGDNDFMHHRVERIGPRGDHRPEGMTLDTSLVPDGDRWHVVEAGTTLATYDQDQVRLSVSWKAKVFADDEARRVADDHLDDLDIPTAIARFETDLGRALVPADADRTDPEQVFADEVRTVLQGTYVSYAS